jgi:hypothetical protein
MGASKRRQLLDAIVTRLEAIVAGAVAPLGDTFETDAGRAVYQGDIPQLTDADPEQAIAVMPDTDEPRAIGSVAFQVVLPVNIHAIAKVTIDDPWTAAEQVVGDIKRAIETDDQTFEGLVQHIEREGVSVQERDPGSTVVAVTVPYRFTFREQWGRP